MDDFFASANNLESNSSFVKYVFNSIYGWEPESTCFIGANLYWPKFDVPDNYARYFLSWHTEQLDIHWLKRQAESVYPRPILVANDGVVDRTVFPDNVEFVRYITWHKQLAQLVERFGVCQDPQMPKYKLSSLCFRLSQYKKFITAYLLKHADRQDIILTYHNILGKQEDLHGYPKGLPWLDDLDLDIPPTFINFNDGFSAEKNKAVDNGGWSSPPFQDALINFTNESFHYSLSQLGEQPFLHPGPFLTEKTWKPLLAGRPFLSVGQYNLNKTLNELGLSTEFGFPAEFDSDPGDLTRIRAIFQTIDVILKTPVKDLYDQSYDAVTHNVQMIKNGNFAAACDEQNEQARGRIREFLSV